MGKPNSQKDTIVYLNSNSDKHKKWIFGFLGYDLKNTIESLNSRNADNLDFPNLFFFVPKVVYSEINGKFKELEVYDSLYASSCRPEEFLKPEKEAKLQNLKFQSRTPKNKYLENLKIIKDHIQRGDIYEANYCVEFYHENVNLAPLATYNEVNVRTKAPYSAFFRHEKYVALCGSPELYLEKSDRSLISKPIKGTRPRGQTLRNDQKERSENVMIVDLVRNDFSKIARKNSVHVEELYGIYTFETVHQMISTVACQIKESSSQTDILKATFPMGSMTGAPKISAMELMETYEEMKRGLYSGAIGYFSPDGDFKFNVVIRTLLYNTSKKYLSLMAGGAITAYSDPESEYRECLLKASALKRAIHEFS